jgi:phosphatidylinositol alpha-1,6-mannosyltransferase
MNVAFFCEGFTKTSAIAMPWRHVLEIASRMADQGDSAYIFTDTAPGLPRNEEENGIIIRRVKKNGLLINMGDLLENLNQTDFDLVNWHSSPLSAFYFLRLRKSFEKEIVWSIFKAKIFAQDLINLKLSDVPQLYKFWNNILCSITPRFIIRKGASIPQIKKIITLSRRLQLYIEGIGINKENITSIPSGVDTKLLRPLSTQDALGRKIAFGFRRDDQIILFFGPLSSPRGADVLISAMPRILKRAPSAKLILLARKSFKDSTDSELENFARKHPAIQLISGVIEKDVLIQYLGLADVIALPFRFWPHNECPLTVLESMAMGKPVITTCTGSISEIVKDGKTGFLVPPGNVDSLSQAITKVLENRDLSMKIQRKARQYVEEFHDWDVITQLTLNVFQKVINESALA